MEKLDQHKPKGSALKEEIFTSASGESDSCCQYRIVSGNLEQTITFQKGEIRSSSDINGTTDEALIAIVIDRLSRFQEGSFPCAENEETLAHLRAGLLTLNRRTQRRIDEEIEGLYSTSRDTN